MRWPASLSDRPVPARAPVEEIVRALGAELPAGPSPPAEVVDLLATACEPGLTAFPGDASTRSPTGAYRCSPTRSRPASTRASAKVRPRAALR
ncbi:hypothetical protein [Streptomyces antibioticus]|uniref:hypothetical protein n=1 Tax=Streptomyces antibioticus TaxID=1890 RepID=UPI003D72CD85